MGWEALGAAVVNRRVELGYESRKAFVAATGLGERNVGDVENHRRDSYDAGYLARLEQSLKWPVGTIASLVDGEPTPAMLREPPGRLTRDPYTHVLLDQRGRELLPEISDIIDFMSPDSSFDDDAREAAQKLLYGTVMALAALARKSRKVRELTGEPEDDFDPGVEVPDQVEVVQPRMAREPSRAQ